MTYSGEVDAEVEGSFRLEDGTTVRRTVRERLTVGGEQTKQRAVAALVERLQAGGYDFAEGHGVLTQLLAQRILR